MINFQSWQGITIQAFGFATTLVFCIEALARITATAVRVVRDILKEETK